ncbi:MAG: lytic transglycosylase domain-containing protein [Sporolactobacillus sp.]
MTTPVGRNSLARLLSASAAPDPAALIGGHSSTDNADAPPSLLFQLLLESMGEELSAGETRQQATDTPPGTAAESALWQLLAGQTASSSVLPSNVAAEPTAAAAKTPSVSAYDTIINQMASKYSVPASLIQSVISAESGGDSRAVSRAGAQGLMQLMPATARALGVTDVFDPTQNIEGGTKYLRELLDTFNGNTRLAVAAYNAGAGSVKEYGGVPPYAETQNYVVKVLDGAGIASV